MPHQITRKHEIHCGHRVFGHEGKCRNLHGHAYVIHFTCEADSLDVECTPIYRTGGWVGLGTEAAELSR